jgi:hypothetical protein
MAVAATLEGEAVRKRQAAANLLFAYKLGPLTLLHRIVMAIDALACTSARKRPNITERLLLRTMCIGRTHYQRGNSSSMQGQGYAWTPGIGRPHRGC